MSSPAPSKKRRIAAPLIHTVKNDNDKEMPTIARAAGLIATARNILVIAGAGISTSCGIPDFRSENGLYALLSSLDDAIEVQPAAVDLVSSAPDEEATSGKVKRRRSGRIAATGSSGMDTDEVQGYHIVDPQEIMDITVFRTHPEVFYKYAYRLFPGREIRPSATHHWLKRLETDNKLLRLYTQNIDGLESQAGISRRLFHAHGTLTTSTCTLCRHRVETSTLLPAISKREVPLCERCVAKRTTKMAEKGADKRKRGPVAGVYKPDITFFHEPVSRRFHSQLEKDLPKVDLCLVIGTSLLIPPVKDIPGRLSDDVPKILINRDPVKSVDWTVFCQGDCDDIVRELDTQVLILKGNT